MGTPTGLVRKSHLASSLTKAARLGGRWGLGLLVLALALLVVGCTKKQSEAADGGAEESSPAAPLDELDLWAGLDPPKVQPGDVADVLEPKPGPQKPPQVGEIIDVPFPPPPASDPLDGSASTQPPTEPVKVLRYGPEGAQGLVDAFRVTFDQPMVPLASIDDLRKQPVPLRIEPEVPGEFRWLGTQTVAFYPEGRLPYSTTYTASIPENAKSVHGNGLDRGMSWRVTTPELDVASISPADDTTGIGLEPTLILTFNQPVQRDALQGALALLDGGRSLGLVFVEPERWADSEGLGYLAQRAEHERARTVVARPSRKLQPDTTYTVAIPAGVYGEGPNRSQKIERSFSTYPPLTLAYANCNGSPCSASHGIHLSSSTHVRDPKLEDKIRVEPEVPDMKVHAAWRGIQITGKFRGDTSYQVHVDAGLEDEHGQHLARAFDQTIRLGPLQPMLQVFPQAKNPGVVESKARHTMQVRAAGLEKVELTAVGFDLDDVSKVLGQGHWARNYEWPESLPSPSFTETLDVTESRVEIADLELDLDRMRKQKPFVYLVARSNDLSEGDYEYRRGFTQTVAITDLGVSGAFDADDGVVLVTRLSDGEPVQGAKVRLIERDGDEAWSGTTDAAGTTHPEYGSSVGQGAFVLVSTSDSAAFLELTGNDLRGRWVGNVIGQPFEDRERVFFFNDRQPVKPGETMHVAGILRREKSGPKGEVAGWASDFTAKYKVTSPRGLEVAEGDVKVGPFGTFSVDVEVPADGDTGQYSFQFTVPRLFTNDLQFWHSVAVETYRTPEFKVEVSRVEDDTLRFGDELEAEVRGAYYQGSALVGAEVSWTMDRSVTDFNPPGAHNDGFTFGWGNRYGWWNYGSGFGNGGSARVAHGEGELDKGGVLAVTRPVKAFDPAEGSQITEPPKDEAKRPPRAATYTLNAVVTDQNRQAIAASGSWVVHPGLVYAGLRAERTVLREGEQGSVDVVAVGVDGNRQAERVVDVRVIRKETVRKAVQDNGRWTYEYETKEHEEGHCEITTTQAPKPCTFDVTTAGAHEVRAIVRDDDGRETESQVTVYVTGKDAIVWDDERKRVDIVADKRSYEPGETARLLLRSPFDEARGVFVVEREGIADSQVFEVKGGAHTIDLKIEPSMVGGLSVSAFVVRGRVDVQGAPEGQDLGIPDAAAGELSLDVSTDSRKIDVEVRPASEAIAPGSKLDVAIVTTDQHGRPVPASVAVMVVDEGVLALMGHKTPDPLSYFWHRRTQGTGMYSLVDKVLPRQADDRPQTQTVDNLQKAGDFEGGYGAGGLGMIGGAAEKKESTKSRRAAKPAAPGSGAQPPPPAVAAMPQSEPMEEEMMADEADDKSALALDPNQAMAQSVSLRTFFATTAFFDAEVETNALGIGKVSIDMPENLTTFRIMVVAVDQGREDRFGSGESTVKVRKPIMLRPSLPRFANLGDKFEGSVMVDNQTDAAQQILVGVRGANVEITGEDRRTVEVPAGESKEVRFDMEVAQVGNMRLQFAALSNAGRDATELTVPVNLPATRQAFATYGATDESVRQAIEVPEDALVAFGGLELSFSSTALNGLEDAVEFLVTYPYECVEQTASRIMPIFALGPVLDDFPIATVVDKGKRQQLGAAGIEKIMRNQAPDGGFGYWNGRESWPYVTTWATLALLEGKKHGFDVDEDQLTRATQYLENFVRNGYRTRWGTYYDWTTRAFALWLLSREGKGAELFDIVWAKRADVPLYAKAMLMGAAHRYGKTAERDQMLELMRDAAIDDARTVHFVESKTEADAEGLSVLMHSSVQTDAIVLMNLLDVAPDDPLAPKVMAGIMSGRDPRAGGRWDTTHANAWALMAASEYYQTVESVTPDFKASVWLDADFAGEHAFTGRSMAKRNQRIPMAALRAKDYATVTVAKKGAGKLYYRLGLRYAPADLTMDAMDRGFQVSRTYEVIPEANEDEAETAARLTRDDDGTWRVKAGTNVKVTLTVVNQNRANFVVVDDAMPAGFEGQNPRFLTSVAAQSSGGRDYGNSWDDVAEGSYHRWWFPWWSWSHTQMKDDRMLLFADRLPSGVYTYSYTARATSIGEFILPPVHAEAMYEPERFGHSASGRVVVVE